MDDDEDVPLTSLITKKIIEKSNNISINGTSVSSSSSNKAISNSKSSSDKGDKNGLVTKISNPRVIQDDSDEDKSVAELIAKKVAEAKSNSHSSSSSSSSSSSANSSTKKIEMKKSSTVATTATAVTSSKSLVVEENSDSEDDMPFVKIIEKREREAKENPDGEPLKKKNSDHHESKSKSSSSSLPKNTSAATKSQPKSGSAGISAEFYEDSLKGQLIQTLMLRWWYAIEWPIMDQIPNPPEGYESLDGFPGVFVSTRTDSLGKILDLRDKETCPCLINFIKKPSKDLKALCITALENQMKALIEAEGEHVKLLGTLKTELANIKGINSEKADREAEKYEKAFIKQNNALS